VVDEGFHGVLHFAAKSLVAESTTYPERALDYTPTMLL